MYVYYYNLFFVIIFYEYKLLYGFSYRGGKKGFYEINNKIIASFHNEIIKQSNPTKHAEMLVIEEGCKLKNSRYLDYTSIYITLEPCAMCASAISEARIGKLYFGAYDEKKGAIESVMNIYNNKNYFVPEIYGGVKEIECSLLLRNFFNLIRKEDEKKT